MLLARPRGKYVSARPRRFPVPQSRERPIVARVIVGTALLGLALMGCGASEVTAASTESFAAVLTGANARPRPTASLATGIATIVFDRGTATYDVTVSGLQSLLTVAHIHLGPAGSVGPVIVPLPIIAQAGVVAHGTFPLDLPITQGNITISGDSLRSLFESGQAYVNVYSTAYPDGEIRGQVQRR